ncbi:MULTISPECIES: LppX_LprAFG lipoprotein [Streptomyces]|uniref:LppX_LprAFG lipoprotein n=1 Tax=Streptomyces TaxID=1883 RepID=UPI00201CBF78|nr:LppX_LprAFG lipoprotein [Streptomyces panaciradicis]MCL6667668.1 LppX_LprAFG lipoprotein [Streptomyces panaciradicis]
MKTSVRGSVRRGATGAGLVALLLAAGAVGCQKGGSGQSPAMTPAAAVAKAAKNTQDITSMHYRMAGKVPGEGRISGEAAMSMKPPAMSMKMTAQDQSTDGPVEIRVVGKAMYVGGAGMAKEMDGKSWIKFDMSALGADKQMNTQQLGAGQADQNPAADSTFLTGSKDVKKVGTETVDGVKTTHYRGTVTVDAIKASLKGESKTVREKREKALDQYTKMGVDALTMDMWVDGQDHTKQFRMRGDADKGPLDLTITFLDFNKPVKVAAPPAKDTADLAEMMKDLQG